MLGLNPGKVTRQIHDEILAKWVYETNDTPEEILEGENYLMYLNHSPSKIQPGDEILICSKPIDGRFFRITCLVGYNNEEDSFFPIFTQSVNIYTGEVKILTGLEEYLEDTEDSEADGD